MAIRDQPKDRDGHTEGRERQGQKCIERSGRVRHAATDNDEVRETGGEEERGQSKSDQSARQGAPSSEQALALCPRTLL